MPAIKRNKTKYPGVYFIIGQEVGSNRAERIYYITYRRHGRLIEEKAGRQFQDDMTPARAAQVRADRIRGEQLPNKDRRLAEKAKKEAEAKRWTIGRLWEEYRRIKPGLKGVVTDQNRFKNYIEPCFGKKDPADIQPLDIDRFRLRTLKGKSPGTIRNVLELLRRIANFGVNKQLCSGFKFRIELPRANNEKIEDLSPEQLKRLMKAIAKDPHPQAGPIMKLALYTGMRRGEIFRLNWKDVDFKKGFIHLRDPKGGQDQKIPLNDAARELLLNHERSRSPYVFPGRKGRRRTDIHKSLNQIKKKAGLPKEFRALHGLRHVYASMLASSGKVDMYTLQKLLTHKSPQMTQRYAHLPAGPSNPIIPSLVSN
ncbi:MAG: site-specific integrase [Desulfobacterales bacterium]|nr:site-specific integrase [Desulfobacterales bacterium]